MRGLLAAVVLLLALTAFASAGHYSVSIFYGSPSGFFAYGYYSSRPYYPPVYFSPVIIPSYAPPPVFAPSPIYYFPPRYGCFGYLACGYSYPRSYYYRFG